jgi:hypothetical protein
VAQTGAEAHSREERPRTLGRAVEAVEQAPPHPMRELLLGRSTLQLSIGLGQGCRPGFLRVPERLEHAATDHRGQIPLLGETAAVLLLGQAIPWQG